MSELLKLQGPAFFGKYATVSARRARVGIGSSFAFLHCLHPNGAASNVAPNYSFKPMPLRGTA